MDKVEAYKNSLRVLCDAHNVLCRMLDKNPSQEEAYLAVVWFETCKETFIEAGKALGYQDGIDFMYQELPFDGCKIIDGKLYGDIEKAYQIAETWQGFFNEDALNNFKYEIGVFLENLADLRKEQEVLI